MRPGLSPQLCLPDKLMAGYQAVRLRKALWNYIYCLLGLCYNDHDYGSINILLERCLKVLVKTMACHPEQTTAHIYLAFHREL